jgi:hypothetical protein
MVNRGEFVVNCVVNRGAWRTFFRGLKFSSFLKYIFAAWSCTGQREPATADSSAALRNDNKGKESGAITLRYSPKRRAD